SSYSPGGYTPPGLAAIVANPALATADNARAGKYVGGRIGYASGPFDVAFAYAESTIASSYYFGSTTRLDTYNLGGSYDFGVVKLFGEYSNNKQKTDLATNTFNPFGTTKPGANGGLIGVTVPIGAGLIRASYSGIKYNNLNPNVFFNTTEPSADQFAIGYVYNLSKRTALYATYSYLKDKNGANLTVGGPAFYQGLPIGVTAGAAFAAVPKNSQGYDIGIRHAF
ncbi:MAG TPA: porin, partial [Variovorax sp.]